MPTRTSRRWLTALLALGAALVAPTPSRAEPVFLSPVVLFEGAHVDHVGAIAMAGDGSLVVGQITAPDQGVVQVQVRRPGTALGAVTYLDGGGGQPFSPSGLTLHGAPDGALAAIWNPGDFNSLPVVSVLSKGATTWSAPYRLSATALGGTAMDGQGRLWVTERVSGDPNLNRVEIVAADGRSSTRVTIPVLASGAFYADAQLAIGRDGAGHLVLRRLRDLTGDTEGQPCTTDSSLVVTDVRPGSPTSSPPRVLASYPAQGTYTSGRCTPTSGTAMEPPMLTTTSDGTLVTAYTTAGLPALELHAVRAFHRPPGGAWRTRPETAPTTGDYRLTDLVASGPRAVAVTTVGVHTSRQHQAVVVRAPGGAWSGVQMLTGSGRGGRVVATGSAGGAVFAWRETLPPNRAQFRTMSGAGVLSPTDHDGSSDQAGMIGAASDPQGNAAVFYTHEGGSSYGLLRAFDAAGPRLAASVPVSVRRGRTFTARASAQDVWSAPATTPRWSFDGGAPVSGTSVRHAFRTEGRHRVTVTSTDQLGGTTTVTRTVVVPDTTRPRLTRVRIDPGRVSLRTTERGRVRVTLTRQGTKRMVVTKWLARRGAWTVRLPRLAEGRWRVVVVVRDAAGNRSRPAVRGLTVGRR
ncbi:PKD domain-containing protein [Nocardioides sp. 503]|uniref:PKD domain-containing protein n=1 Tax=Nocardioides sp. 503 TaxID=2508326 RepID=UPI00106F933B|nr:PKD domain-containing protein [Nocardioides sp. 503]